MTAREEGSLTHAPDSKAQILVPLDQEVSFTLHHMLRFYLKLYPVPRSVAAFSLGALKQVVQSLAPRDASAASPARLSLRATRHRLRLKLRLPPGRRATPRLAARLRQAPVGVVAALETSRKGATFTLVAEIPEKG